MRRVIDADSFAPDIYINTTTIRLYDDLSFSYLVPLNFESLDSSCRW